MTNWEELLDVIFLAKKTFNQDDCFFAISFFLANSNKSSNDIALLAAGDAAVDEPEYFGAVLSVTNKN